MISSRFATVLHILTLLEFMKGERVSSGFIADSININPVLVRKELALLAHLGLVQTREGKNGGSMLAKQASQIRLSEIYRAVRQPLVLGRPNDPNPACPVGRHINQHLETLYQESEQALIGTLGAKTLEEFAARFA